MELMKHLRGLSMVTGLLAFASLSAASGPDDWHPVSFHSLSLAKAKTFGADFYVDDRDRDPQGSDVFDIGFRFRFQLGDNTELFTDLVVDRVVALPEAPAIPSSPRDLIFLGPIEMIPNAFNGQHPYLDKRGEASVDAFIPGTATIGATRVFRREGIAFGGSIGLIIPMAGSLNALRSGANSGSIDAFVAGLASRDLMGGKIHGRAAFTLAGSGTWPDRSFSVSGSTVTKVETDLPIGNRFDLGVAYVRPITESVAAALEARTTKEFVGDERIDAVSPIDLVLSVHKTFGRFDVAASLLNHMPALPSGALRANPLAGGIDLSDVTVADRTAFLASNGLGAVAGELRDGSHVVVIGSNARTLPSAAFRIAPTYTIRSEHNLGYVFTVTFRP